MICYNVADTKEVDKKIAMKEDMKKQLEDEIEEELEDNFGKLYMVIWNLAFLLIHVVYIIG